MSRDDESSNSIPYLLIGIGIGMIAGALLAPRSGEEIRQGVRRHANEGLDYLNQQADKVRDGAERVLTQSKEWIARQSKFVLSATETRKPYHEQI